VWGDFEEWRYSKNLHCGELQNPRKEEICKSLERYQEYTFFGHDQISAGYKSSLSTAKNTWCNLALGEDDLILLEEMEFSSEGAPGISAGSAMLFSLLDAKLNPSSNLYIGSVYDPASPSYLLKDPCIAERLWRY
jgi:hypothetical protein